MAAGKHERIASTDEHFEALVRTIREENKGNWQEMYFCKRDILIASMVFELGIKLSEILKLDEEDVLIESEAGHLHVDLRTRNFFGNKGFLCLPFVKPEISMYKRDLQIFKLYHDPMDEQALFVGQDGRRVGSTRYITSAFQRYARITGLPIKIQNLRKAHEIRNS